MPDTLDLLAAELAFGLLEGSERLHAEQLRSTDSHFAAAVASWEAVVEAWLGELPEHAPSPQFWDRIAALIEPSAQSLAAVTTAPTAANAMRMSAIWRPLAIAASLVACLFAGLWISRVLASGPTPPPAVAANPVGRFSVAQISGVDAPHLATVLYDRDAGTLTIRIEAIAAGPAKAPEIWLINGSNPPRSLGFGQAGTATRLQASGRLQRSVVGGATLAITLEPVADHPHTAPSSKILGTGTISTL